MLTLPREAGTPEAQAAREILAAHLSALGYDVAVQRFSFPPATLDAFPLFGIGLGWLGLVLAPLLGLTTVPSWAALAAWIVGLAALGAMASGVALGWAAFGAETREDANLVATPPGGTVRRWIVAHADTKAQGHSMAGRIVAVWVAIAAIAALSVLAALRLGSPVRPLAAAAGAVLSILAGSLAARGRLRGRSPGARDNGSGLLAALAAAGVAARGGTGILITGAEEFGLVGARIFARIAGEQLKGVEVINVDTVDDEGTLYVVSHDAAGAALAGQVLPALQALGVPARTRGLPLGIFVDSHPLARAGARAVTVGRLNWRTLRLLHTPRDTPDGLDLELPVRIGEAIGRMN